MEILTGNQTKVEYNRSTRRWEIYPADQTRAEAVAAGHLADFPAGPEGKRAAQLAALQQDCPDVAFDVKQVLAQTAEHPEAEAIACRAIEAGFLVRDGHVLPRREMEEPGSYVHEIARVRSQRDEDVLYAICFTPERQGYCECIDWHNGHQLDILADYYREHPDDPQRPRNGAPKLPNGDYACKHILAVRLAAMERKRAHRREQQLMWAERMEAEIEAEVERNISLAEVQNERLTILYWEDQL